MDKFEAWKKMLRRLMKNTKSEFIPVHHFSKAKVNLVGQVLETVLPTEEDVLLCERLLNSYGKARKKNDVERTDAWSVVEQTTHRGFLKLLASATPNELADYLCDLGNQNAADGILQGIEMPVFSHLKNEVLLGTLDKFVSLAESMGVLFVECPEQGYYGKNIYRDLDHIISEIEMEAKFPLLSGPHEGGLICLNSKNGPLNFKDAYGYYAAKKINQLIGRGAVCEIGAGGGRTAFHCINAGIKSYSIYDLPQSNVIQGFFLGRSFPGRVSFFGEEDKEIKILPFFQIPDTKSFDLTFNQDSFPEIDKDLTSIYLDKIKNNTKNYFLSINQEGRETFDERGGKQGVVLESVNQSGGFEKISRMPYWLRQGYVEELFSIKCL